VVFACRAYVVSAGHFAPHWYERHIAFWLRLLLGVAISVAWLKIFAVLPLRTRFRRHRTDKSLG